MKVCYDTLEEEFEEWAREDGCYYEDLPDDEFEKLHDDFIDRRVQEILNDKGE